MFLDVVIVQTTHRANMCNSVGSVMVANTSYVFKAMHACMCSSSRHSPFRSICCFP